MCLEPVSAVLTLATGLMSFQEQRTEAKSQANMYNAKAQADEQNAREQARRNEQIAERYAQEQQKLSTKHKLLAGNAAAEAGASGISGMSGSVLDLLSGSTEAYHEDSLNLLANQRNDVHAGQVQQYNFKESAKANRVAAYNVRQQGKMKGIATLLGTASSVYGLSKDFKAAKSNKTGALTESRKKIIHDVLNFEF